MYLLKLELVLKLVWISIYELYIRGSTFTLSITVHFKKVMTYILVDFIFGSIFLYCIILDYSWKGKFLTHKNVLPLPKWVAMGMKKKIKDFNKERRTCKRINIITWEKWGCERCWKQCLLILIKYIYFRSNFMLRKFSKVVE